MAHVLLCSRLLSHVALTFLEHFRTNIGSCYFTPTWKNGLIPIDFHFIYIYICSWVKADKHWYVTSSVVSEGVRWFTGMSLSIYASDCGWIQCSIELECPFKSVKGHIRWLDDCIPICCLLNLDLHHIFVLNWIYIYMIILLLVKCCILIVS